MSIFGYFFHKMFTIQFYLWVYLVHYKFFLCLDILFMYYLFIGENMNRLKDLREDRDLRQKDFKDIFNLVSIFARFLIKI